MMSGRVDTDCWLAVGHHRCMTWLMNAVQATSAAGPEAQIGTIAAIIAAIAAISSALIGLHALGRTETREHHRWLQEKRREAYVAFLIATRDTYEAISTRGNMIGAADLLENYHDQDSKVLLAASALIHEKQGEAARSLDLLVIVGPERMITAGRHVMARLRLDWVYYSPTRWTQLGKNKARIMELAEATGDASFLLALKRAYAGDVVDLAQYRQAHHDHRLEDFWGAFTREAQKVLEDPTPARSRVDGTFWSDFVSSAKRNI